MLHLNKESVCVSEILSVYVYVLRIGGSKVLYIIIKVFMIFKKKIPKIISVMKMMMKLCMSV